ncbi:MAG: NADH-quinone oxidoreductase subunit A [Chloroflexi bacterium]|nr:NADH-quinone oxidoreductase subunit A [Chloroflexota bacterium]
MQTDWLFIGIFLAIGLVVESVFLFPWAVAYKAMPFFMVFEGILFILLLVGALVYIWRKGVLEWA